MVGIKTETNGKNNENALAPGLAHGQSKRPLSNKTAFAINNKKSSNKQKTLLPTPSPGRRRRRRRHRHRPCPSPLVGLVLLRAPALLWF